MTPASPPTGPGRSRPARFARLLWRARDRTAGAWLAAAAVAVSLGGAAAAMAPLMLARVVDRQTQDARFDGSAALMLAGYVAALLVQRGFEQAQAYAYGRGEQRLVRRLSSGAFEHMLRLPMSAHLEMRSGALAQALSDGGLGLRLVLFHAVMTLAPVLVQLCIAAAVIGAVFDPSLGVVLAASLLAYAGVFAWGVVRQDGPAKAISAAQLEAGGLTADGLMNVEQLKVFVAEARFAGRYDAALAAREAHWRLFLRRRLQNGLSVALVFGATLSVTLALAARQVAAGDVSLGGFVLVNAYVLQLVRPLEMLGFALRDVGQGLAYVQKLLEVLEQRTEPSGAAGGLPHGAVPDAPAVPAALEFRGVSFGFGRRLTLQDLSLRIAPGSRVAVVGPTGAGKSSLLRLILRLHEPRDGEILLDGRRIADLPLAQLRSQIAVVSQDTILFNDSIAENIRLAAEGADLARVEAAAAAAHLGDLLRILPDGLETPVGERGLKLSGGEKQRVAIARAALKRARLVLFDEATAALDPATERAVLAAMGQLSNGATTVMVTHRLSTVVDADEIFVLQHGRLVEAGSHGELLARAGLYAELWRAQAAARPAVAF